MKSFKHFLNENEIISADIIIHQEPDEINGSLINYRDYSKTICKGGVWINANHLLDLRGCPIECNYFNAAENLLTSLEGGPMIVDGECDLRANKLTSLTGIGRKYFKTINKSINISNNPITSSLLGLGLIEKLADIKVFKGYDTSTPNLLKAKTLIEVFLASNEQREILDLKEFLITYGLKEYAKL